MASLNRSARLFLIAMIIDGIAYSAWILFYNFYILERGFSKEYLGLVNAMPSIAALIFGIPIGMLSDRWGRKRSMMAGVGVSICFMAVQLLVSSPNLILIAAFIVGLANMLFYISQAPFMMNASTHDNRALLFSVSFGLWTISGAVGNLFAGQLPDLFSRILQVPARDANAYRAVLLISVGLSILTLIPLAMIHEEKVSQHKNTINEKPPFWRIFSKPITQKLAIPNLLLGFGAAILIPYMNVFFLDKFALPDQQLGVLFSLLAVFTGIGCIIGPRLAHVLGGKIRAVVATQIASVVFLLILGYSPVLAYASISFLMRGVLMNLAVPLFHAFAMEQVDDRHFGTFNSIMELNWQTGYAVGPYISGIIQQQYGFNPLFAITAILYTCATLMVWVFFRSSDRLPNQSEAC
ncbi:MAG: MFS transporter [Anaerolineales bacterium]|nr:MFS transporter [Anaerolineales bacterium]